MENLKAINLLMKENFIPNSQNIDDLKKCDYDIGRFKNKDDFLKKAFEPSIEILKDVPFDARKLSSSDFVEFMRSRYVQLKNILMQRPEVQDAISLSRATEVQKESIVIALIFDLKKLNGGSYKLEIEDLSGKYSAIISKNNAEALEKASFLVMDEVVAFKCSFSRNIFFIKDIIWPDIPMISFPKYEKDDYIVFSSDVHVGSDMFLEKNFNNFILWLRGELGDEKQKELAKKVKYVFFIGDIVDGIGIYPRQDKELLIKNLKEQFNKFAEYIKKIPSDKKIIICPGNHDGITIEEPQEPFLKEYASELYALENVKLVQNPCLLRLHKNPRYSGINILLYHGYSFDYFVDKVEFLRLAGGYDKAEEIMKFLLKRRHLAPCYGSTLSLPMKDDSLIITQVPHVFATGHIHKVAVGKYKGVRMISSSCWQAKTGFQEKVGHHPEPGKVPILNLKTGDISVLDFS